MRSVPSAVADGHYRKLTHLPYPLKILFPPLRILNMWNDTDIPLAYFISFRTYGTWLHGDERGSIDRFQNKFRSPYIPPNPEWRDQNARKLKIPPVNLKAEQRVTVKSAIQETCEIRQWPLLAINVRTNHVHTVVTASNKKPEIVLNAFKANATRRLREEHLWRHPFSPWADRGSKRRLWNEQSVQRAIDYVLYGQGMTYQTSAIKATVWPIRYRGWY